MAVYKKIYNCLFIAFLCGGSGIFFGVQGALASEVQKTKIEIVKSKLASGVSSVANLAQKGAEGARAIGRDVKGFVLGSEGGFAENIKRRLASLAVFVAGGLTLRKWLSSAPAQEGQPDPVQERQPENGGQVNQVPERVEPEEEGQPNLDGRQPENGGQDLEMQGDPEREEQDGQGNQDPEMPDDQAQARQPEDGGNQGGGDEKIEIEQVWVENAQSEVDVLIARQRLALRRTADKSKYFSNLLRLREDVNEACRLADGACGLAFDLFINPRSEGAYQNRLNCAWQHLRLDVLDLMMAEQNGEEADRFLGNAREAAEKYLRERNEGAREPNVPNRYREARIEGVRIEEDGKERAQGGGEDRAGLGGDGREDARGEEVVADQQQQPVLGERFLARANAGGKQQKKQYPNCVLAKVFKRKKKRNNEKNREREEREALIRAGQEAKERERVEREEKERRAEEVRLAEQLREGRAARERRVEEVQAVATQGDMNRLRRDLIEKLIKQEQNGVQGEAEQKVVQERAELRAVEQQEAEDRKRAGEEEIKGRHDLLLSQMRSTVYSSLLLGIKETLKKDLAKYDDIDTDEIIRRCFTLKSSEAVKINWDGSYTDQDLQCALKDSVYEVIIGYCNFSDGRVDTHYQRWFAASQRFARELSRRGKSLTQESDILWRAPEQRQEPADLQGKPVESEKRAEGRGPRKVVCRSTDEERMQAWRELKDKIKRDEADRCGVRAEPPYVHVGANNGRTAWWKRTASDVADFYERVEPASFDGGRREAEVQEEVKSGEERGRLPEDQWVDGGGEGWLNGVMDDAAQGGAKRDLVGVQGEAELLDVRPGDQVPQLAGEAVNGENDFSKAVSRLKMALWANWFSDGRGRRFRKIMQEGETPAGCEMPPARDELEEGQLHAGEGAAMSPGLLRELQKAAEKDEERYANREQGEVARLINEKKEYFQSILPAIGDVAGRKKKLDELYEVSEFYKRSRGAERLEKWLESAVLRMMQAEENKGFNSYSYRVAYIDAAHWADLLVKQALKATDGAFVTPLRLEEQYV